MRISTQIILAFSMVILFSVADTYINYRLSRKVESNVQYLSQSEALIRNSNRMHKAIIQMQSAFRGYLLTGDSSFLDLYYSGIKLLPGYFSEQRSLCKDNLLEASLLDSIISLHKEWINFANSLISSRSITAPSTLKNIHNYDLFENQLRKQAGKKLNDSITQKFLAFDRIEYKSRNEHSNTLISSIEQTHNFSLVFIILTVIAGLASAIFIAVRISQRITSMVRIAGNISQGNFSVVTDNRNDELTDLARSLNIMSERLDITIHDLENRNAELNKFAYVVSHDLKAPLRGIHNVIKWIREDLEKELSPELKRYLDIIPQRTKRMEDLINGLLDYARSSEKKYPEHVDMNELVKDITEEIVPRDFAIKVGPLPEIVTERLKIEQVFTNLVSNSVRYTTHLPGEITISSEDMGDFVQFSVKDNGIGIDPEYHEKIFGIFQTLREKDEKESTGVGLAIVKKIIEDKRGKITVISKSGHGTEIVFTWPKTDK